MKICNKLENQNLLGQSFHIILGYQPPLQYTYSLSAYRITFKKIQAHAIVKLSLEATTI